ncbi:MAG TPA: hypothetical protein VIJ82_10875 [Streptosporangiaceae bacterium]|jgi:hypothetical protein
MSDTGGGPGPAVEESGTSQADRTAEQAELARLRAEVAELRSQLAGTRRHRVSWRTPVAVLLIVVGCLLAPVSVLAVWSANQVSNTDRYVANIEPLIHDPVIQNALTDKLTIEITSRLNVTGLTSQAAALLTTKGLPRVGTLLKSFGPAIASAVTGFIHGRIHKIVTSARFANTWIQVNKVAHRELVTALSGQGGGAIAVSNGKVAIDLAPFIAIVKQDLSGRGFTFVNSLPSFHPTLALFSARDLVKAQTAYRLINDLKIVLPILSVLLMAAGVYIARGHRRALVGAGLGLAASMLVLGAALIIFRGIYLNTVPASVLPSDAAAAMFDTLVRFIKDGLRLLLVVGLIVALAGFFTGRSATAVQTRAAFGSGLGRIRRSAEHAGLRTGPVGSWTYAHRTALRISVTALAALIFVFWGRPTVLVAIVIVVLLLAALALIELFGRPPVPSAGHP